MAYISDVGFVLDGHGMVLGYAVNCFLHSFPVWSISQYVFEFINWYECGAHICWRQLMIHQEFVQVKNIFLQNVVVDNGYGI